MNRFSSSSRLNVLSALGCGDNFWLNTGLRIWSRISFYDFVWFNSVTDDLHSKSFTVNRCLTWWSDYIDFSLSLILCLSDYDCCSSVSDICHCTIVSRSFSAFRRKLNSSFALFRLAVAASSMYSSSAFIAIIPDYRSVSIFSDFFRFCTSRLVWWILASSMLIITCCLWRFCYWMMQSMHRSCDSVEQKAWIGLPWSWHANKCNVCVFDIYKQKFCLLF